MSKGLGRIEREILMLLRHVPKGYASALELAVDVYNVELPEGYIVPAQYLNYHKFKFVTVAQHSVVRRALATLLRKGLVQCSDRHWRDSMRMWALASADQPFSGRGKPFIGNRFNGDFLR
jgi:hypothetical protein